jgi:polyisoprenoid-binding protein YceI
MTMITKHFYLVAFLMVSFGVEAKVFDLDKDHTSVGFKVRHLLTNVQGSFRDFSGKFETNEKGALVKVEASVKAASIDTNNKKRDEHLRSEDFFDAKKFPELRFVSDPIKIKQGSTGKMPGQLTMHGVTKPVEFEVEYLGETAGPGGGVKAGATANVKINRKDFGLSWNKTLEAGRLLVGEDVTITLEVEGNERAPAKK